jgi:transposase
MRGKKGEKHPQATDPPRRRANKKRGRGTYANDRVPILGTVGRETGQIRLEVVTDTRAVTLQSHVERFSQTEAIVNTDEYPSYNHIARLHDTVTHATHEWARDEDGDGYHEVHCNSVEGLWAEVRTFLRPFKGVHKKFLAGYIALCEFRRNLKRVSPSFIAQIVAFHSFYP